MFLTIYKSRYLDALNLGDEVSTGLGIEVEKERRKLAKKNKHSLDY